MLFAPIFPFPVGFSSWNVDEEGMGWERLRFKSEDTLLWYQEERGKVVGRAVLFPQETRKILMYFRYYYPFYFFMTAYNHPHHKRNNECRTEKEKRYFDMNFPWGIFFISNYIISGFLRKWKKWKKKKIVEICARAYLCSESLKRSREEKKRIILCLYIINPFFS